VLGYSPLQAGVKMLPIAIGMVLASKLAVGLTRRLGTKFSVALGLATVAAALAMIRDVRHGHEQPRHRHGTGHPGPGHGLRGVPGDRSHHGRTTRAKAGIGSAMNDVVREVGGTLGIAVLGSVLTSSYGSGLDDAPAGLPHPAAEAASDGVGAAHEVGAQIGGGAGTKLIDTANSGFVDAKTTTATLAAAAAVTGALIALAFLPSRARAESPAPLGIELLEPVTA
jgi:DHA2 family multidrug resistance protein-like MFS transporter